MKFFDNESFISLGNSFQWRSDLLSLHVFSDALIAISFFMIPSALIYLARKRRDLGIDRILFLFASFLVLCGLTHVLSIVTIFEPIFAIESLMKLLTGIVSVTTAVILWKLMPRLLNIPTRDRLEAANAALQKEVAEHKITQAKLLQKSQAQVDATKAELVLFKEVFVETSYALKSKTELHAETARFLVAIEERYKETEKALKTAKEEAESASHAKSAFLANMSHEIRTPLGVILGLTDLITANEIEADEWEEYTLAIRRNGELLLKIINDILDISKVEAGRLELDNVETDINELIEDLHTLLQFKADEKQLQFDVESGEDLPNCILIDSLRLKQILFNVVGNALKFTDNGSVKLKVRRDTPKNCILFDVVDTGPGLSNEQRERLFKPYTQAEASMTRKYGGSGLGLALSRQLALAMGGDLRISETALGRGTIFTLSLPIVAVNPKIARERRSEFSITSNGVSLDGLNVLVVDDSPDNLMLVSRILKKAGANVTTCEGGLKALDMTASEIFHVVLMDLQMPDMDGYRVTEILRKRGFAKPIFALTAHAFKEERIRCLQSGFDGHLIKPVDKDQLVKVLNSMARRINTDTPKPRVSRRLHGASAQSNPLL